MKITFFTIILCLIFPFYSFASESEINTLIKKEITINPTLAKKSKSTLLKKQKKLNFKERLALKLVTKKIKKAKKKQIKSIKTNGNGVILTTLISVFLILGGLIGGIVFLALGETLLGILLLLGGLIVVPLFLVILLLALFLPGQVIMC